MSTDDAARWDAHYEGRDADVTPVPPEAVDAAGLVDRIPMTGRALDVACGLGAQTIWMAQRGLDVTALDVSSHAVRRVDEVPPDTVSTAGSPQPPSTSITAFPMTSASST